MSNRGRQNVPVSCPRISVTIGALAPSSSSRISSTTTRRPTTAIGSMFAGVGNDPRASRQFNTIKQAKDYDSHGDYVKMWIPALAICTPTMCTRHGC